MNGPGHYAEAERCMKLASMAGDRPADAHAYRTDAMVHATLANAAATAMTGFYPDTVGDARAWDRVAGVPMPGGDDD